MHWAGLATGCCLLILTMSEWQLWRTFKRTGKLRCDRRGTDRAPWFLFVPPFYFCMPWCRLYVTSLVRATGVVMWWLLRPAHHVAQISA